MSKIYVVTSGQYSDYSIDGVFDDKNLAQKFIDTFGGDIEEWRINPHEKELREGYKPYFVRMAKNGDVDQIRTEISPYGFRSGDSEYDFDAYKNLIKHCLAKDEEHAIKITNELRIFLIAENMWKE